jgi:hypothetical protein
MSDKYILDGHTAKPVDDVLEWGTWFETANRRVAKDTIGDSEVSTVFIGLDHSFGGDKPLIFETMVFDGPLDGEMDRYSTWEEAEKGHADMVKRVEKA